MNMLELDESTFTNETNSGIVAIDFWADWCAPCRMFGPVFQRLSEKYEGKVKFCKVDSGEYAKLAALNGVSALPTVVIMKDGHPVNKLVGVQPEKKLAAVLDGLL
jgi:thioredoxin 1